MTFPFAIGITGHRPGKLNLQRLDCIAADIARVFAALDAKFAERRVICISSIAEGADTMAADAALALGWKLVAPIPFPAGHYARDFEKGKPLDDFRRLMNAAAHVQVCTPDRLALRDETDGYIAASAEMLHRSDALIAVWNGAPTELLAGAYDTLIKAVARGMPALWIDSEGIAPPRFLDNAALPALAGGSALPDRGGEAEFLTALG